MHESHRIWIQRNLTLHQWQRWVEPEHGILINKFEVINNAIVNPRILFDIALLHALNTVKNIAADTHVANLECRAYGAVLEAKPTKLILRIVARRAGANIGCGGGCREVLEA